MKAVIVINYASEEDIGKKTSIHLLNEENEWVEDVVIKPLPQMKEEAIPFQVSEDVIDAYQDPYATGFNDAIRLITGEKE